MEQGRLLTVPGTYNLRDVGGYEADGGRVRHRKLLRSDGLHRLGEQGRSVLGQLGVGLVIDLRDDFEVQVMPDDLADLPLEVRRFPVFEGATGSVAAPGVALERVYETIALQHADVVGAVLSELAASGETTTLIHCTAGKDRTGVMVAFALLAVGVDRETVVEDYAVSEANLAGEWLESMVSLAAQHGATDGPELRALMGGSPPDALDHTITMVEREHGSITDYLLAAGMGELDLARLREVLVEPTPR